MTSEVNVAGRVCRACVPPHCIVADLAVLLIFSYAMFEDNVLHQRKLLISVEREITINLRDNNKDV